MKKEIHGKSNNLCCGENRLWSCNLPFNAVDAKLQFKEIYVEIPILWYTKGIEWANALNKLYYVSVFPNNHARCRDKWMAFKNLIKRQVEQTNKLSIAKLNIFRLLSINWRCLWESLLTSGLIITSNPYSSKSVTLKLPKKSLWSVPGTLAHKTCP